MKRFVIGDIHGRYKALKTVLSKSNFHYEKDLLIVLGDVVDGGTESFEVVEELLKFKNLVLLLGNHDNWLKKYIATGWKKDVWLKQGGQATLKSYQKGIPDKHKKFFDSAIKYHILDRMCFVHAGFKPNLPMELQLPFDLMWDRTLIQKAISKPIPEYCKIFIGHTSTQLVERERTKPLKINNLWMMDCGAGWDGKLAIMNIDTEQYWLSEKQNVTK